MPEAKNGLLRQALRFLRLSLAQIEGRIFSDIFSQHVKFQINPHSFLQVSKRGVIKGVWDNRDGSSAGLTTVRLTPLMAIEPLSTSRCSGLGAY